MHATTWMHFKNILLRKKARTREHTLHDIIFIHFYVKEIKTTVASEGQGLEDSLGEMSGVLRVFSIPIWQQPYEVYIHQNTLNCIFTICAFVACKFYFKNTYIAI